MRIAICDDEPRCLEQVRSVAEEYMVERAEKQVNCTFFSHPEDLLEAAEKSGGFDIYILDIVMPDLNGIRLGVRLRDAGYDGKIIYLTSSEEYALDSFKVKAFDYLIKPIEKGTFFSAVDEAIAAISAKKDKSIVVKAKERSIRITFDSIAYAALSKRSVTYYLMGGKSVESMSLRTNFSEAVRELLADRRFTLCGASMAVNLDHITEIESEAVVFGTSYKAFLGKKACRELRNTWNEFLFSAEEGR